MLVAIIALYMVDGEPTSINYKLDFLYIQKRKLIAIFLMFLVMKNRELNFLLPL